MIDIHLIGTSKLSLREMVYEKNQFLVNFSYKEQMNRVLNMNQIYKAKNAFAIPWGGLKSITIPKAITFKTWKDSYTTLKTHIC